MLTTKTVDNKTKKEMQAKNNFCLKEEIDSVTV